jgi:hypothetical protein
MNIGSGLSEITSQGSAALYGTQKVYLWPVYNAGKVDPVFRVAREIDGHIYYNKTKPEDRPNILAEAGKSSIDLYGSNGAKTRSLMAPTGSLFDAYV